ncbi:hypothetical protein PRZ48_006290 [Zasmidium cellare]|uniref:Pre-mRNA-splicing factor CWC24 n=1 Tax=Zasmidium cellare TaxID=395010 RepID=A0ABR0EMP2_ZASCE|nr:hypothetical protein PRZ48_006290 [Zasmidium cellare]
MADVAAPVFKKRANKANIRKRPATPPPQDSASDSDYSEDEAGVRVKRRKKEGVTTTNTGPKRAQDLSKSTAFEADRSTNITVNEDATKASQWYTDAALAASEAPKSKVVKEETVVAEASDGKYQGTAKYSTFIQKNPDARQVGPVKAPTNVRAITVTDFAPDVCKDYKQTGFCGFGDSCKFLHAREDYKQGWQLDKEWESAGKKDKAGSKSKDAKDDMDEEEKMLQEIPFACIICKESYKNPVVTKCGHYFCEKCAMGRYMKEKKKTCAACGADTNGSFGMAKKLKDLLDKKRKRAEERKSKAREAGEEVSDDDE